MANLGRLPLSAFDPRLRALIERGCREYVEVACDTSRKAQHLRNVLTTYRARLKQELKEERAMWEPLYGAIISTKKSYPNIVTLRPRLSEFSSILDHLDLPEPSAQAPELEADPLETLFTETEAETKGNSHEP
jgi:hypothetical protein